MSNGFIKFDPDLADENMGHSIFVLCILFSVLITLSTISRICMKLLTNRKLGATDYFVIIALVSPRFTQ